MSMSEEDALNYRRGRSGRPYRRLRVLLKAVGSNVCWLCAQPIDMDLPPRHPLAWSLDHAIPLSVRPDLALDEGNAREAHLGCNARKGARTSGGGRTSRDW